VKNHPKVLILDDDADLRDSLGEVLTDIFQAPCVAAASYDDLVALGRRALDCQLAILDVNLGPNRPSGIDAFEWLVGQGFQGRIVFLTGHARTHPAVERASRLLTASVHQKPMTVEQLGSLLDEAP
jgi:DNA-binding NtrC family response regulator